MNQELKQGLTMIEIILYVLLLTIMLGLVTNFFYQIANFKINQEISSSLFQNSQLVINKLSQDFSSKQVLVSPIDENYQDTLTIGTPGARINWTTLDGMLKRNTQDILDNKVIINLTPPNYGFRKLGNSLQVNFQLTAKLKPFGQQTKSQNYQTAIFLGY